MKIFWAIVVASVLSLSADSLPQFSGYVAPNFSNGGQDARLSLGHTFGSSDTGSFGGNVFANKNSLGGQPSFGAGVSFGA